MFLYVEGREDNRVIIQVDLLKSGIEIPIVDTYSFPDGFDPLEYSDCHQLNNKSFPSISDWNYHSSTLDSVVSYNVCYKYSTHLRDIIKEDYYYCVWDINDHERGYVCYKFDLSRLEENISKFNTNSEYSHLRSAVIMTHPELLIWLEGVK